ncbi:MAG: ribosome small subunit-dependent GTPase A [Lautropia sp.]
MRPDAPQGEVIAAHGRNFLVRPDDADAPVVSAVTRGRNADVVVGDRVHFARASADQAVIEQVAPRRNLVRRSDAYRTKAIAANVDQAIVVVSGHPAFDERLLLHVALALSAERIPMRLAVTKIDLADATRAIAPRLAAWRAVGTPVDELSLLAQPRGVEVLRAALAGRRTLLLGQSGMGKSTLVNALVPDAEQRTAAISLALASGRHTTTFSRVFPLDGGGTIIDSPGFQAFGISHLSTWEKAHAMPEFAPLLGSCRFNDCRHRDEPGCAIRAAVACGSIDALRYRLFGTIVDD